MQPIHEQATLWPLSYITSFNLRSILSFHPLVPPPRASGSPMWINTAGLCYWVPLLLLGYAVAGLPPREETGERAALWSVESPTALVLSRPSLPSLWICANWCCSSHALRGDISTYVVFIHYRFITLYNIMEIVWYICNTRLQLV